MAYRNASYTAFYVDENQMNKTKVSFFIKDLYYYQLLKSWKQQDNNFPFIDAHGKTYNVRDKSDWESTLKPRLHERLRMSKNIVLILSEITQQSKALCEEITYGIDVCRLPVIVAYPDFAFVGHDAQLSDKATELWDNLPCFKSRIKDVPTAHIPFKKQHLKQALNDSRFSVHGKSANCTVGLNTSYEQLMHQVAIQI